MVRTSLRSESPARAVPGRTIGFIGRGGSITKEEAGLLWYIGRCFARLNRPVILVPKGAVNNALREGVIEQDGDLKEVSGGVLEEAQHTFILSDDTLTKRLKSAYADIRLRPDVTFIESLEEWYDAMRKILTEKGVSLPD